MDSNQGRGHGAMVNVTHSRRGSRYLGQTTLMVQEGGVVVNHCFTSLFGVNGLLSDIVIREKRCSQLMK